MPTRLVGKAASGDSQPAFSRRPSRTIAILMGLLLVLLLALILAPVLASYDPIAQFVGLALEGPSFDHPLGTDDLGRDILARMLYGGRTLLFVTFSAVALAVSIGAR